MMKFLTLLYDNVGNTHMELLKSNVQSKGGER